MHPYICAGEMAERSNAAVLKTVDSKGPGVRIPLSPHSAGKNYRHFFMPFFTYILYSQQYNKHYYGSCSNLEVRLKNHNAGKVRSTKAYRPYEVKYFEEYETKTEALQREKFFKSIDGYRFLKEKGII